MAACLVLTLLSFVVVIMAAASRVRSSWRDEPLPRHITELQHSFTRARFAVPMLRRRLSRSLERNPIGWLQHYSWTGRITKWGWFGVIMMVESLLIANVWDFAELQIWVVMLLLVGMAFTASASFRKERESGALELLLVCPLSVAQIIGGRLRGIWMQFVPSGAFLALCLAVGADIERYRNNMPLPWMLTLPLFIALPVVGLYFSMFRVNFLLAWLLTALIGIIPAFFLLIFVRIVSTEPVHAYELLFPLIVLELILGAVFWRLLYERVENRQFAFAHA
jgi:hypothetical protein